MKVLARSPPAQSGHFLQVLPSTEWIPQNNRSNITSHCSTFTSVLLLIYYYVLSLIHCFD